MDKGFKHTDAGIIPNDWNARLLSEISDFENGKAHEQFIDDKGDYIVINSKFISTEGCVAKCSKVNLSPLKKGNIAIVMSDIPNGKALAKCFLVPKDNRYTLNQRIGCIKPFDEIDNDYLFYKLNRNKYFLAFDSGSGQTNLKKSEIMACPVALPPTKAEQTAIATVLNDADALIQKLEQLIAKKRNIKKGAMQELLKAREGWEVKKLGEVAEILKGQLITEKTAVPDGIPVIGGGKTISYYHNKPNRTGITITVSASGAYAGYVSIHNYPIFASDCSTINESDYYDIYFLYFTLLNKQKEIYSLQTGGGQPHVYPQQLVDLFIPIPKQKSEQTRIAQILTDMDNEIEALEKQLEKYKKIKQGMMQVLLTGKIRLNLDL